MLIIEVVAIIITNYINLLIFTQYDHLRSCSIKTWVNCTNDTNFYVVGGLSSVPKKNFASNWRKNFENCI